MQNTDRDWKLWGKYDPYFGVLADPIYSGKKILENRANFFATGQRTVSGFLDELGLHSTDHSLGRALDHGCGVGRLTIPLAKASHEVVAMDVSEDMLCQAVVNVAEANCDNVSFFLADDHLTNAHGAFDIIISHLVLQHIPVARGLPIFCRLLDRLAPGGAFFISVSFRNDQGPLRWLYRASTSVPGVKAIQNVLRSVAWDYPSMQMNHYPLDRIFAELSKRHVSRLSVSIDRYHKRFQTVCLTGRMPSE